MTVGGCLHSTNFIPSRQGKHLFRIIQPAEYDEALQRTPWLCTLAAVGDLRSGQELLDAAASDAHRSMGALAATRHGREALDRLAAHLEAVVARWASG